MLIAVVGVIVSALALTYKPQSQFDSAYVDAYIHQAPMSSFGVSLHADGSATLTISIPEQGNPKAIHDCSYNVDAKGDAAPGTPIHCN